ncbi:hypothetical protein HaLaN_32294, partial [Haematococcus lacustris]
MPSVTSLQRSCSPWGCMAARYGALPHACSVFSAAPPALLAQSCLQVLEHCQTIPQRPANEGDQGRCGARQELSGQLDAQFQLAARELMGDEFMDMVLGTKAMEVKWLD